MNSKLVNKILIADDDKDILYILKSLLVRNGYDVFVAENGVEVVERSLEIIPDLVIMDINMPIMNGYEACEKIRNNVVTENIPVIFLSGLTDMNDKKRALQVGGNDYLVKPFSEAELIMRINSVDKIQDLKKRDSVNFQEIISNKSEKMIMLETIAMGLAHEVNNPLTAIKSTLAVMNKISDDSGICELVDDVKLQVSRIERVTSRVLKLANNNVQYFNDESISNLCHDIIEKTKLYAEKKNIKINVTSEIEDIRFLCDAEQFKLAITNIIKNAVDFSSEGSDVLINCKEECNNIFIEISDRGQGINDDQLSEIFLPFFSSDSLNHLGLGLSISKGIIDNHFGKIEVVSKVNEGTTVRVVIPLVSKNKKIMIVDDDRQILKHLKIILERSGYKCCCADNGERGLSVLEENNDVDIIVTDFFMPIMDGFDFTKKLKSDARYKDIPVIGYTGFATTQNIEDARNVGILEVMTKPFALDEFKNVLEKYS